MAPPNRARLANSAAVVDDLIMITSPYLQFLRIGCCALLALAVSACDSAPANAVPAPSTAAPTTTPGASAPQGLAARIAADIGDAACDNSQQCRTLAYGHKACGGPERYVAYSTKRSDATRLTQLAQQLADERRRQDEAEGMMSTCSLIIDPGALCQAGRCTLQSSAPGGAPLAR